MSDQITAPDLTLNGFLKLAAGDFVNRCREQCVARMGADPLAKEMINQGFRGLGSIVNTAIDESEAIPKTPMGPINLARHVGILKPNRARGKRR